MKNIEDLSREEKINLAVCEDTPVDVLEELALSEDVVVRNHVAANLA